MGPAFAAAAFLWLATLGYAMVGSGLKRMAHCRSTTLDELLGRIGRDAAGKPCAGQQAVRITASDTAGYSTNAFLLGDASVAKNQAKGARIVAAVKAKWPRAQYAGSCSCRHQRGTGSDPSEWSVHSVCGAVDFFAPSHSPTDPMVLEIKAWANSPAVKARYGIEFAIIDASPGDVHIQFVPNLPAGYTPPCARGAA